MMIRRHYSNYKQKPKHKQKGVALLVIMLIVAIVTVLATEMVGRLQLNMARTINIKGNNQAYWYAIGSEEYARKSLGDLKTLDPSTINLSQPWAQEFNFPIEGGSIQAQLYDLHACFNLNSLGPASNAPPTGTSTNPPPPVNNQTQSANRASTSSNINTTRDALNRLISLAGRDEIDNFTADTVADSLADWLDEDSEIRPFGAEDSDYESQQFPYSAANSLMTNSSELRLVNGVELRWLNLVMPLTCVIPNESTLNINVNTLTAEQAIVLAAIADISVEDARSLINARPIDGYNTVADFLRDPSLQNMNEQQKTWITVKSNYFMLDTKTRYNGSKFNMSTIFNVFNDDGVEVVSREFRSAN